MIPPTLRVLLNNQRYRAYLKKIPRVTPSSSGFPWQVWAQKTNGKWASRLCPTYPDSYKLVTELYPDSNYKDLCIVSRSRVFPEPGRLAVRGSGKDSYTVFVPSLRFWDPAFEWCGRCRRPTRFRYCPEGHRALKNAPAITFDEPYRCYYCGARRSLAGGIA